MIAITTRLREESGIDIDRAIREATVQAEDRAAKVAEHGGDRKSDAVEQVRNANLNGKRQDDRSYIVGRLKREAKKAEGADPLFLEPEVRMAAEMLPKVLSREISANAAGIALGWRQKTITIPADVTGAAKALKRHFTVSQLSQLTALIIDEEDS